MSKQLLDVKEFAELLGIDIKTAYQYVERNYVRSVRLPSLVREGEGRRKIQIPASEVDRLIEESIAGPTPGPIATPKRRKTAQNNGAARKAKDGEVEWFEKYAAK